MAAKRAVSSLAAVGLALVLVLAFGSSPAAAEDLTWTVDGDTQDLVGPPSGPLAGPFADGSGVTIGPDGLLWTVDNRSEKIHQWERDPDGNWVARAVRPVSGANDTEGLTWMRDELFAVLQEKNGGKSRISYLDLSAGVQRTVTLDNVAVANGDGAEGIVYSPNESTSSEDVFYIGVEVGAGLYRFVVPTGNQDVSVSGQRLMWSNNGASPVEIAGLSLDRSAKELYIVDDAGKALWMVSAPEPGSSTVSSPIKLASLAGLMQQPEGIAIDPARARLHVVGEGSGGRSEYLSFSAPWILGDVNCDGRVNFGDPDFYDDPIGITNLNVGNLTAVRACPASTGSPFYELDIRRADVNFDGKVTVVDALFIARCAAGLPNTGCPEVEVPPALANFDEDQRGGLVSDCFNGEANALCPAEITSPVDGSTLACGDVELRWEGSSRYSWVYVGSSLGGRQYHNSGNLGTATSTTIDGLPNDGSAVYVRLWSYNGSWERTDVTYTACTQSSEPAITGPAPGSTLPCGDIELTWSGGNPQYVWVYAGSTPGSGDYSRVFRPGGSTSATVKGLPSDGSTVFIRLWSYSDRWRFQDVTYTACG